jgi:hypothetical protein
MKRDINVIGIDIAKRVFHVIGMNTRGTIIHIPPDYMVEPRHSSRSPCNWAASLSSWVISDIDHLTSG